MSLTLAHDTFRDLISAAEAAGWDLTENKVVLDRAREGFAALVDDHASGVASDDDEPHDRCTRPGGHSWVYTGTQYGGDDASYHGEGRCYCEHCGADGDA